MIWLMSTYNNELLKYLSRMVRIILGAAYIFIHDKDKGIGNSHKNTTTGRNYRKEPRNLIRQTTYPDPKTTLQWWPQNYAEGLQLNDCQFYRQKDIYRFRTNTSSSKLHFDIPDIEELIYLLCLLKMITLRGTIRADSDTRPRTILLQSSSIIDDMKDVRIIGNLSNMKQYFHCVWMDRYISWQVIADHGYNTLKRITNNVRTPLTLVETHISIGSAIYIMWIKYLSELKPTAERTPKPIL